MSSATATTTTLGTMCSAYAHSATCAWGCAARTTCATKLATPTSASRDARAATAAAASNAAVIDARAPSATRTSRTIGAARDAALAASTLSENGSCRHYKQQREKGKTSNDERGAARQGRSRAQRRPQSWLEHTPLYRNSA
jgi:hypothetical protein